MRLLIILLLTIATTSCVTSRDSSVVWEPGTARARQQAEAYVLRPKSQPLASKTDELWPEKSKREDILQDFTEAFFSGFTAPDACLMGPPAAEQGLKEGQNFRRRCSKAEVRQFMEDYGYTATEAVGTWTVRFEVNCFRPRSKPDEGWWLDYFGNTKVKFPKDGNKSEQPIYYQITGFLSSKGSYGHFGSASHQFYATRIVYIKPGA